MRERERVLAAARCGAWLRSLAGDLALWVVVLAALAHAAAVSAQPTARAACQQGSVPESVSHARTVFQRNPDQLGPLLQLADALMDQGCYEDAVAVLEAGQSTFPHNGELSGKLRDVRSMLTEQTYISGITEAEDVAKQQHEQLRCTQLSDVEACNEALRLSPNDTSLLVGKADGLMQRGHPADAAAAYQRVLQLNPGNEAMRAKLAAATARANATSASLDAATREASAAAPAPRTARRSHAALDSSGTAATNAQTASAVATLSAPSIALNADAAPVSALASATATPSYSNDAALGRSN